MQERLCPLLAISGHNLNAVMMALGLLTLCPLLAKSGHKRSCTVRSCAS